MRTGSVILFPVAVVVLGGGVEAEEGSDELDDADDQDEDVSDCCRRV